MSVGWSVCRLVKKNVKNVKNCQKKCQNMSKKCQKMSYKIGRSVHLSICLSVGQKNVKNCQKSVKNCQKKRGFETNNDCTSEDQDDDTLLEYTPQISRGLSVCRLTV